VGAPTAYESRGVDEHRLLGLRVPVLLRRESLARSQGSREEALRIERHPFDLRSRKRRPDGTTDHSVDDGRDDDYFEQAGRNVRRLARRYDVEMDLDVATDVDSLPARVVSYHLRERHGYGTWLAFDEAVFGAPWPDGRDVGAPTCRSTSRPTRGSRPTRFGRHSTTTRSVRTFASGSRRPGDGERPASRRSPLTATRRGEPCHPNGSGAPSRAFRTTNPAARSTSSRAGPTLRRRGVVRPTGGTGPPCRRTTAVDADERQAITDAGRDVRDARTDAEPGTFADRGGPPRERSVADPFERESAIAASLNPPPGGVVGVRAVCEGCDRVTERYVRGSRRVRTAPTAVRDGVATAGG
jgi:hypothetical protein